MADPQRRGCLISNTVMELAPHELEIAGTLRQALKLAEDTFFKALARAKLQGELSSEKDPRALARFLTTMMQGTIVMIKAGSAGRRGESKQRRPRSPSWTEPISFFGPLWNVRSRLERDGGLPGRGGGV